MVNNREGLIMSVLGKTDVIFFEDRDLNKDKLSRIVDDALGKSDDGSFS